MMPLNLNSRIPSAEQAFFLSASWKGAVSSVNAKCAGFPLLCLSECMISICQRYKCRAFFFWLDGRPGSSLRQKVPKHGWILFYKAAQQNGKHCPWHSATCAAGDIWLPRQLHVNVSLGLKGHPESVLLTFKVVTSVWRSLNLVSNATHVTEWQL